MIVPTRARATLLKVAQDLPTPALIYDLDAVRDTVAALRSDLAPLGDVELLFAVKANRCPGLLKGIAALGLGGNIASLHELRAARKAGLYPLSVTSPGLEPEFMNEAVEMGARVYLDTLTQVEAWGRAVLLPRAVGLRLRLPLDPSNRGANDTSPFSRFGVNPADPDLHAALGRYGLHVTSLHVHAGEMRDLDRARQIASWLAAARTVFSEVSSVNLGGGLTYLYAFPGRARAAFAEIANGLTGEQKALRIAIEPGMLLTALAGTLLTRVLDVRSGGHGGTRHVTVDASAWNLATWSAPRVWGIFPARDTPSELHDLAGTTCYEQDYFVRRSLLPALQIGDRVLLSGFGAYAASMARSSHGMAVPREWVLQDEEMQPGEGCNGGE